MDFTEQTIIFWFKLETSLGKKIPSNLKNAFHACGYSNSIGNRNIDGEDIKYVEDFVREELLKRLNEKCNRLKMSLDESVKSQFFGSFCNDERHFEFSTQERNLIMSMPEAVKRINSLDEDTVAAILQNSKEVGSPLLQLHIFQVDGSDATIIFLQLISDVVNAFMDEKLSPSARVEKMWHSVFLTRIWRRFISGKKGLTLNYNCMTNYTYYCIELNAHSLVMTLKYLKDEKLTHIFTAHLLSSQPCESFYRAIRSMSTVNSTVINCSVKEMLHRISRIQLLNDISNDKESGFSFPESLKSNHSTSIRFDESEFPTTQEIYDIIQKCKKSAIEVAEKVGMIKKGEHLSDSFLSCQVPPYVFKNRKWKDIDFDSEGEFEDVFDLEVHLMSSSLKNYSQKVKEGSVSDDSSYVEIFHDDRRLVFKKTSLCWLFAKESYKCSSDRIYRVRNSKKTKKQQSIKQLKSHRKPVQVNRRKGKK